MTTDKRYSLVGSSMGGGAAKASEGVNTHAVISQRLVLAVSAGSAGQTCGIFAEKSSAARDGLKVFGRSGPKLVCCGTSTGPAWAQSKSGHYHVSSIQVYSCALRT